MLSLLSEVHFWTLREDISISNSDFGAFRYYDKKSNDDSTSYEGKKSYAEKRGHVWVPQNKRPVRLKENIKELEEHLSQQRIVLCQWRDCSLLQLMFSSGLFVNVTVNIFTGDPISITFDKFLVGKLLSDYVADVVFTKSHLICSYNDSQLTLIYFAKPTLKRSSPKSFSRLDPRIHSVDLAGPTGRRLERKLACNVSGDMVVVWWHSSHDEVYPWSPVVKDQDRANVLVYGISGLKADLLCHHRSEFDLLSISFSQIHSNIVRLVEQKVSRNGDVTVESSSYQVSRGSMLRTSAASISLPTHVCCHSFSPLQDKLLLGCIDGSLVLYDEALGVTHIVKAAFIPATISWHPDGGIFVIANERCQFQILDAALATLKQQLLSEDVTESNLLDITSYFRIQPTLRTMKWNKKAETNYYGEKFAVSDCLLLLLFERGPIASLRYVGGGGLSGDIHSAGGFTFDSLVMQYLWSNNVDKAINLLSTLNWDIAGSTCLSCLQRIVNHLFKLPMNPDLEVQIQTALGCFHMPIRPMCPTTVDEFKAPVRDLTRRFFHHLLRYKLFEKAFRLAIDLMDRDLFMDIYYSAKRTGQIDVAEAAFKKAEQLDTSSYASSTSGSSHSDCSRSSCSQCSDTTSGSGSEDHELVDGSRKVQPQANKVVAKTELENQSQLPIFENKAKVQRPHPPLPIVPNVSRSRFPGNHSLPYEINSVEASKFLFYPPIWETNSSSPMNMTSGNDILYCGRDVPKEKVVTPSLPHRPVGISNERPKVKFCDTVTQITLPDRLHTLPEEEEEPHSSLLFPNAKPAVSKSDCVSAPQQKAPQPHYSFTHSANSLGIPLVPPSQSRLGLTDRRPSDLRDSASPSYSFLRPSGNFNPALGSQPVPNPTKTWALGTSSERIASSQGFPASKSPLGSGPSSLPHHDLVKDGATFGRPYLQPEMLRKFEYTLDHRRESGQNDSLNTEELSALLPGSRKPLSSGTNSFERNIPSSSMVNGSDKSISHENAYLINCNNSIHDLSEEDENNGTIKIVHFGVV